MQWNRIAYMVLFVSPIVFSQTYIIKFKTDIVDSSLVYSLVQQSFLKTKTQVNQRTAFSVRSFTQKLIPSKSNFPWQKYSVIHFTQQQTEQFLQSMASNSSVEYIQPSVTYKIYSIPNDSAYGSQWNLRRIGISTLLENGTIQSSLPSVKVGVIDTGIDDAHPDLAPSIALNYGEIGNGKENNGIDDDGNGFVDDWRGYDFVDSQSEDVGDWNLKDNDPNDENGHGTLVSGVIGAQINNGVGLAGIFPAKILPLRAFGKNGNGSDIDIASAIIYAADNGADVINMSFGDVVQSQLLHDAVRYAYSKNIVIVASSGNDGSNYPHYPSDFSEVISTGSVNQFDSRSFFSAYSPGLDIMAPGEQIVSTVMGGGYTDQFAGTSASAPHISGVSALIKSLQKQKKLNNSNYVELSNEEIRGVLLNSADDAGEKGWDKFYGAGIVNAAKAIQAVSGSNVVIHSPMMDEIVTANIPPIVVTASTPYLKSTQLFYGIGEDPTEWNQITSIEHKILIRDTITYWDITSLNSNNYTLRFVVKNSKGNDIEFRQRIRIELSNPKILSFKFQDSVIVGNEYGGLVEARVDRNSYGTLFYRKVGDTRYKTLQSLGLQMNHSFVLSSKDLVPQTDYEFYCEFTENSASRRTIKFPTTALAGVDYYPIRLKALPFTSPNFVQKPFVLPAGFLLNSVQTINGKPTVLLNEYTANNDFGKLKAYQFSGNNFTEVDSSAQSWVPRALVKNSGEGKPAILVQDRGTSQLLQIDTLNGKFFTQPIWGDSTDIWASQLVDLNGDNKPEIIARSSSEYLIYQNLGNNNYSLLPQHFPNPSFPLPGDARNQFGPPKSIVGDFTNSGRKEIIFADYDGDVLLYRQTGLNSLNFELAGIDTTDLYEMSDYIVSGDFNGDGISDFAVLGHSNLDWNNDREYDAPVWTVRVFSHLQNNPVGTVSKIWAQQFIGVKAGSGYDNGISVVKRFASSTRDELFISLNPYGYIFSLNSVSEQFIPVFFHSSQSNSVITYDFDFDGLNELGFNTNGRTEFWSSSLGSSNPSAPFALTLFPIDSTKIRLRWSTQSTVNSIYKGTHSDSLIFFKSISGIPEMIDSLVSIDKKYFYAVTAVGAVESPKSPIVSITPHKMPTIVSATQTSISQVIATLSFDVSSENLLTTIFVLDSVVKSSSIVWKSSRSLLITFPQNILTGNHSLRISQLTDASGMAGDTTQAFSFLSTTQQEKEFFVRSVKLLAAIKIQIEFNEPVDFTTANKISNYSVKTIARNFSVISIDSVQPTVINLNFSSGTNLSVLALRLEINISENIRSLVGTRINSGKGQTLSIAQETQSIDNIVVYPNPAKSSQQISFVNIPENCAITIYSAQGNKIKTFSEKTTAEGISWDLRDDRGNLVSTGIYLYRVEQLNSVKDINGTKLGKFAVIR